ncbi:carboxypeptidase-like regulatory domain-containing protein [uncultured Methanobrevibacter sp.]|uniref:carboxypeptidase-like regulatory domain-containing protein n=1 Tax=uncultured Methanobrevibacter sp. TaxID=253161 RepID=UPI0025E730A9|nr:carboxypeptidase-like regulatory domain-containing protein [uncultured Methanobrevibacter sp.]
MNPENIETVDSIHVSVTDESNNPVGQVDVAIGDITSTTGNAGGCTLRNVPVGTVTITATKEGYENYTQEVNITSETETLEIILEEI